MYLLYINQLMLSPSEFLEMKKNIASTSLD